MLSLKCDHPLFCEFPIFFSTVKLKFFKLIHRFNICILKYWYRLCLFSNFPQFITKKFGN